jgi:hypothetical protein
MERFLLPTAKVPRHTKVSWTRFTLLKKEEGFTMKGLLCQGELSPFPQPSCAPVAGTSCSEEKPKPVQFGTEKSRRWSLLSTSEQAAKIQVADQRCSVKGCVFPAASGEGNCVQHDRQRQEPSLFSSRQPSMLLLDRAKFGSLDAEPEDSRANDRRRMAKIRENFLDGVA